MSNKRNTGRMNRTAPAKKEAIEPAVEVTETDVAEVEAPAAPVEEAEEEPTVEAVAETAVKTEGASEALVRALDAYVEAMNPVNPISIQDGVREQKRLRGAIINAIAEGTDEQAIKNIQYILDYISADTTGCFGLTAVFRFYDSTEWKVPAERKEMETLLTLFTATAKPATRGKEARRLDWEAVAKHIMPLRSNVVMARLRRVYGID